MESLAVNVDNVVLNSDDLRGCLNIFRSREMLTDVTVVCGDHAFPAHKVILATSSRFFYEILTNDANMDTQAIALNGLDHEVVKVLLDFIYVQKISFKGLTLEKLRLLLITADILKIQSARQAAVQKLKNDVNIFSFRRIWKLATKIRDTELEKVVFKYVANNLKAINNSSDFLSLPYDTIVQIIHECKQLMVPDGEALEALSSWMKFNNVHCEGDVNNVLFKMKMPTLNLRSTQSYVASKDVGFESNTMLEETTKSSCSGRTFVKNESKGDGSVLFQSNGTRITRNQRLDVLLEAIPSMTSNSKKHPKTYSAPELGNVCNPIRAPVVNRPSIVLIGCNVLNHEFVAAHYLLDANQWCDRECLDIPFQQHPGILYNKGCVYMIGGIDSRKEMTNNCYRCNLKTKRTQQLAKLRFRRSHPQVVAMDAAIYVLGGIGHNGSPLNQTECLEQADAKTWIVLQSMRDRRNEMARAAATDSKIFISGGTSNRCEFFCTRSRTWNELPLLPDEFRLLSACIGVARGNVVVFGNKSPNKVFVLENDGWQWKATRGQAPESVTCVTSWDYRIVTLSESDKIHAYDVLSNNWSFITKVPRGAFQPLHIDIVKSDS